MGWALGEGTDLALLWQDSQAGDGTPSMGTGTPRVGMGTESPVWGRQEPWGRNLWVGWTLRLGVGPLGMGAVSPGWERGLLWWENNPQGWGQGRDRDPYGGDGLLRNGYRDSCGVPWRWGQGPMG